MAMEDYETVIFFPCSPSIFFFFFFDLGFTALSRIFHLYQAYPSKGGQKPENLGKNHLTIHKQSLAFRRGSNHSGEKPNGLRVNSPIHWATGARCSPTYLGLYVAIPGKAPDKGTSHVIFSLFLHENISCGYSLEVPWQGTSNDYHNICFHGELRKISLLFG